METKKCKFYAIMGVSPYTIDAWIQNDQIYSTLYDSREQTEDKPDSCFYKLDTIGGIHSESGELVEYSGSFGEMFFLFETDGKWGYGNPWSNKIFIKPIYDFAWPFNGHDYAVVCKGGVYTDAECWLQRDYLGFPEWGGGGKCGLINRTGELVIPYEYDSLQSFAFEPEWEDTAEPIYYYLAKRGNKYGVVNAANQILIPFEWDNLQLHRDSYFLIGELDVPIANSADPCSPSVQTKYALFGREFQQIATGLDKEPDYCLNSGDNLMIADEEDYQENIDREYYVLKKGQRYGIVRSDGELIAPIELTNTVMGTRIACLGRSW